MHRLAVGERYHPDVTHWPETVEYNYRSGQHELCLFIDNPTDDEVEDVRRGPAQFALVLKEPALFLCVRFGRQPWMDCAYTWHRVPPAERQAPPEMPAPQRPLLTVLLVDARTGILRVIRVLSWTPAFGVAMHRAIRAQIETPWPGDATYERHIQQVYEHNDTTALVAQAILTSTAEDDPGSLLREVDPADTPDAQLGDIRPHDRPTRWLRLVHDWYPDVWIASDAFRRERVRRLPDWPAWCYLPMAGAHSIVTRDRPLTPDRAHHVAIVAALAAWRATQGIYTFDPDLLGELFATPLAGPLPIDVVKHSPEWCPYLVFGGRPFLGARLHGAWVHLDHDINSGRDELRILLDIDNDAGSCLSPAFLYLLPGATLAHSLDAADVATKSKAEQRGIDPDVIAATPRDAIESIISTYLYLCSQAADIRHHKRLTEHPRRPPAPRNVQGPTTWEVGYRLGPQLRAGRALADDDASAPRGAHTSPRPHVRRAHWHAYWLGPHDHPDVTRTLELRWLHPILVGALDQVVPVVRDVGEQENP